MQAVWIVVAALALLAGCGTTEPAGTPKAPSTGRTEYVVTATVLEDASHGPQLCLGPVLTSLPPQCGGPDIPNWNWDNVAGETRRNKTVDGLYLVHGTYTDGNFTLTRSPEAAKESDAAGTESERSLVSPCPEPKAGWFPAGRPKVAEGSADQSASTAAKLPGYSEVWLDQSRNKGTENDDNRIILNVRVTRDVKGAETAMRTMWAGALCVSKAKHTHRELLRIQDEVTKSAGRRLLEAGSGDDRVDLMVILDEGGALQRGFDAKYGKGSVRVNSALRPADR